MSRITIVSTIIGLHTRQISSYQPVFISSGQNVPVRPRKKSGKRQERLYMRLQTKAVQVGNIYIGGDNPIVVQTMCNTHTSDVEASVEQCVRLYEAGAQLIRLTVPSMAQVESLREIKSALRERGIDTPLVADVHFSSDIAIAAAKVVEITRVDPDLLHNLRRSDRNIR